MGKKIQLDSFHLANGLHGRPCVMRNILLRLEEIKRRRNFQQLTSPPPLYTTFTADRQESPPSSHGGKKKFSMWRPFLLFVCVSLYEAAPSYRRIPEMGEWLIWLAFLWGRGLVYYAYSFETTSSSMLTTEWKKKKKNNRWKQKQKTNNVQHVSFSNWSGNR